MVTRSTDHVTYQAYLFIVKSYMSQPQLLSFLPLLQTFFVLPHYCYNSLVSTWLSIRTSF